MSEGTLLNSQSHKVTGLEDRAFTLTEILVSITIILILLALLFPVIRAAKVSANKTVSLSNMTQIGTAIILYAEGNDDIMPPANDPNTLWLLDTTGFRYGDKYDLFLSKKLLPEYLAVPLSLFRIPADPGPSLSSQNPGQVWQATHLGDQWISYGHAEWLGVKSIPLSSIGAQSTTTLLFGTPDPIRNARAQNGLVSCQFLDLHTVTTSSKKCLSQLPEPARIDL